VIDMVSFAPPRDRHRCRSRPRVIDMVSFAPPRYRHLCRSRPRAIGIFVFASLFQVFGTNAFWFHYRFRVVAHI
jgi:hypothetical protein